MSIAAAAVRPRKWNSSSFIEIAAAAAGMRPSNASIGSSRCRFVVLLVCYLVSLFYCLLFTFLRNVKRTKVACVDDDGSGGGGADESHDDAPSVLPSSHEETLHVKIVCCTEKYFSLILFSV